MSAEQVAADQVRIADASLGPRRAALRLACGVTACFCTVEALDWDYTFVAPVLAAQLLVKMPRMPTLGQGVALLAIIGIATGIVFALSTTLIGLPPALVVALALVLYLSFYAQLRGAPELVTAMLQMSAVTIPVFAVVSSEAAAAFAVTLSTSAIIALLAVFAAHLAFPDPGADATPAAGRTGLPLLPAPTAARAAACNTLILMPPLLWYLMDENQIAVVMLIVMVTIVRQHASGQGRRTAIGLILGNLIGGVAAALTYTLVQINDTLVSLAIACLAVSLIFAGRIATAGALAPVIVVAFATFLILLALGLTPLPGGSGGAFVSRLVNVLLASAYAIGALSLFGGWRGGGARP